jgi:signal transduction histidine kinase
MISPGQAELLEILRRELRLRSILVVLLPIGAAVMWLAVDRQEIFWAGLVVSAIQLCLLGLILAWTKWGRYLKTLDYFVLTMDIVSITIGLHYLGGIEFPFDWVYAVILASISIVRGLTVGLIFAQWSVICYGLLAWAEYSRVLPHMALFSIFISTPLYSNPQYLISKVISNAAIFNLAALNAAFFSGMIKQKVEERSRELKQAQVQLVHSQKLANLGQLAASLAHGLASPITGIRGAAELLLEDVPENTSSHRRVEQILHWAEHLADLLERLRNFARPPEEEKKPVKLNQIIRDVLDLTSKQLSQSKIQVTETLDPDLPPLSGSARQLEELFMNLVLNARDAMPSGGKLSIQTSHTNEHLLAQVSDTGIGMSAEVKKRLFEPFFTTKGEQGSGLGLNISRQIVVEHGGRLWVESEPGRGSSFFVELPLN